MRVNATGDRMMLGRLMSRFCVNGMVNLPTWVTRKNPPTMPNGHPKIDSAMLASGLLTDFIRLRAAMKLSGMARIVPSVVANKARKTVSTIFSQVSLAVMVN